MIKGPEPVTACNYRRRPVEVGGFPSSPHLTELSPPDDIFGSRRIFVVALGSNIASTIWLRFDLEQECMQLTNYAKTIFNRFAKPTLA